MNPLTRSSSLEAKARSKNLARCLLSTLSTTMRSTVVKVGFGFGLLLLLGAEEAQSSEGPAVAESVASDSPAEPLIEAPDASPAIPAELKIPSAPGGTTSPCAEGMQEVEGEYCANVEQKCLRWLDKEQMRCAEFAPTSSCVGKTTKKHFCIDRFEYPNKEGEKPVVMNTWYQAKASCEKEGKRLCGESEWTLACEGNERLPYPYGYERNSEACNIDKSHPAVNEAAIADPATRDAEVARLDQRVASGEREACVSPFGVHDMTGNVDEWVVNEAGVPFKSGLKGGYWGPVRTRCRPMTTAHPEEFSFYQIGFRCCADAGSETMATLAKPTRGT